MGIKTGNPTWVDRPDTSTPITAQALNNIEDALDSIGGGGGGAPLSQPPKRNMTSLIPRDSAFNPGNSRLVSHYNAEEFHATSLGVVSRLGDGISEHMLVIYTSPAPNTFELFFNSPIFVASGEEIHQFSCDLVIPRGVLFVQILILSGAPGYFNSGIRNKQYEPMRDVNNSGAAELSFALSSGWTPPQTVTISSGNYWEAGPCPQIVVSGEFA